METSPSGEATSRSAFQEIPNILWDPKIHYSVHKNTPRGHILSHMVPVHTTPSYFCKVQCHIILILLVSFILASTTKTNSHMHSLPSRACNMS
jgi:hypothetical protein